MIYPLTTAEKFWNKVKTGHVESCWLWQAGKFTAGYGAFAIDGSPRYAHRIAWELFHGCEVPGGMCICHKCDVRDCVNPDHLFLGTHLQNMRDMYKKKRNRRWRRPDWVDRAVTLYESGVTQMEIASSLGTTQASVSRWLASPDRGIRYGFSSPNIDIV